MSGSEESIGIVTFDEALRHAEEAGLDLVEVAGNSNPAVCRLMDFGKHQYEMSKKKREGRKKQQQVKVKEVQFHPRIEEHDFQTKFNHMVDFLQKGYKVKVVMFYRGREMAHMEIGEKVLERVLRQIADNGYGKIDSPPSRMGRRIVAIVASTCHRKQQD